ncbi:MarR family winged helix-turn-helix transcriptional regulator [uncultured Hymenobacter sp.]|uniref:MarR family winged helix-turn-helix transcriptional regulator n=1 Tax=uncultured Hymenobacter sp. TaxID=170016 RepID=UPI0035CC4027
MARVSPTVAAERLFPSAEQTDAMLRNITQRYAGTDPDGLHFCMAMGRLFNSLFTSMDKHFTHLGITQGRLIVLLHLNGATTHISPSTLALHCGVSRAAITKLLAGLEKQGYIQRVVAATDRRALTVQLTPAGRKFLDETMPNDQRRLAVIIEQLSVSERQDLLRLLTKTAQLFRTAAEEESKELPMQ